MTATITSKGQITIPVKIRKKLGLATGHRVRFDEDAPYLKAYRVIDEKRARSVFGSKKKELAGKSVEQWIEWLRGPVELPPHGARRR